MSLGPVVEAFDAEPMIRRVSVLARSILTGEALTVHRQGADASHERLHAVMEQSFDAVVVDHLQVWPWLEWPRALPVLLVMHNVESQTYQQLWPRLLIDRSSKGVFSRLLAAWVVRREAKILGQLERRSIRSAQRVACLSEEDAIALATSAGLSDVEAKQRVFVLPGYPLLRHAACEPHQGARRIGLIGTWTWAPNMSGLRWFLDEVAPLLGSGCVVQLAGHGSAELDVPTNVQVLGTVPDAAAFLASVDVIAVPSLFGTGVQEKAIEAIGHGQLIVATRSALRGLGDSMPAGVVLADSAVDFAHACQRAPLGPAVQDRAAWIARREGLYRDRLQQALFALQPPSCSAVVELPVEVEFGVLIR